MFELETSEKYIVGGENNFSYQTAQPTGRFLKFIQFCVHNKTVRNGGAGMTWPYSLKVFALSLKT